MTLTQLLSWYRSEWSAEVPGRIHVHLTDPGGDPDWHERFRQLINGATGGDLRSFPLRWHLRDMSRRGTRNHRRARFLYVLTCQDFDPEAAGWLCYPESMSRPGFIEGQTHRCLSDLYRRVNDPERNHEDGRPRTFVERRISRSEAQAAAEAA